MKKNRIKGAFTLIEMLIVSMILWFILTIILSMYFKMTEIKADVVAKTKIVKDTNELAEMININMKNYTIDYEEYFNRRQVWCNWADWKWEGFKRNVWDDWYCKNFTHYWNWNSLAVDSKQKHILYYCSSIWTEVPWSSTDCQWSAWEAVTWSQYIYKIKADKAWCEKTWLQSFWQYKLQFWDVKWNADWAWWCQWDDDDTDLWRWIDAILDNGDVKELYLISKDRKKRIFLRRKKVREEDFDMDWSSSWTWEKLYKLQILKLRWFDIWSWHELWKKWVSVNDGKIDTRACDAKEWFVCKWDGIWSWYPWYFLPKDENDWWADLTSDDISISQLNFAIFPSKNYDYAWYESDFQIAPYVKMQLKTSFYPTNYRAKLNPSVLMKYTNEIQTTFSIKPY